MSELELERLKQEERGAWAAGEYGEIALAMFWDVGRRLVEQVGVREGEKVLDVACGTGNAAIRAAEAGGDVVGVDLTPELFETARRLASEAGVEVEWVEGDAEALPFADGSFDVVLSVFGVMFAPRHEVAAGELARVLRPGGRIGLCSWTPESAIVGMMRAMFAHLPQGPEFGPPPPFWGVDEHVLSLFEGSGIELRFAREHAEFRSPSVEEALCWYETAWGPFVAAREQLGPDAWQALRADLQAVLEQRNEARDGSLRYRGEYLVVLGERS